MKEPQTTKKSYKLTLSDGKKTIQVFSLDFLISDNGEEFYFSGMDGIDLTDLIAEEVNKAEGKC